MNKKVKVGSLILINIMALQGCSSAAENTTQPSLETVDLTVEVTTTSETSAESTSEVSSRQLEIEIRQDEHTFVIHGYGEAVGDDLYGTLLTQSYPETANVYRVNYVEPEDPFNTPLTEWPMVLVQIGAFLNCSGQFQQEDIFSHSMINEVIGSMTRLDSSALEQMDIVESAYSDMEFSDYVVRSIFPAISSDIYKVTVFDTIIDTIVDREFNYYVIRQSLDGIPYSVPSDTSSFCDYYNDNNEVLTSICPYGQNMFYDGTDVYEVDTMNQELEVYLENQTLLSFDQACELATPMIYSLLSRYNSYGWDVQLYAAELVYVSTIDRPTNNLDSFDWYLYPYWVIYSQINYVDFGEYCAFRYPIFINAVTGEVHIINYC